MSDPLFDEDDEANTPLEAEEREQLIPSYITLRRELNEAEQINIADAAKWLASRKRDVLDELHKRSAEASGLDPRRGWSKTHE